MGNKKTLSLRGFLKIWPYQIKNFYCLRFKNKYLMGVYGVQIMIFLLKGFIIIVIIIIIIII